MTITSPRMGSGKRTYPYKRKLKAGNPPAMIRKAQDGGEIEGDPILSNYIRRARNYPIENPNFTRGEFSPFVGQVNWMNEYINSPKYTERLRNFYQNPEQVKNRRSKQVQDIKYILTNGNDPAVYRPDNNTVSVNPTNLSLFRFGPEETRAHEISHATNANFATPNLHLTTKEEDYILNKQNAMSKEDITKLKKYAKDNNVPTSVVLQDIGMHDLSPVELKSDIDALRYLLKQNNIYDAGTQDINKDILNKAKKNTKISNSGIFDRLQRHFNDDDLIDVMNKIALNTNSNTTTMTAKYGKKIKRMQNGGSTDPVTNPLDQEVLDWTRSYIASPKYRQRLANFYRYPDYIQRQRSTQVGETTFNPAGPSTSALKYYPADNDITIGPIGVKNIQSNNPNANPDLIRQQIVAHELGHATTSGERAGSNLSALEQSYIINRNRRATSSQREGIINPETAKYFKRSGESHDILPTESKADIDATRFLLNKVGIYDARTQDITPEILQRARQNKALQTSPVFKRLQENFDDQALIDILNRVALNTEGTSPTSSMVAKSGGKIKKYQEGGPTSETLTNLGRNMASYFLGVKNTGIVPSDYRPTKSSDPNAKYYTWPNIKNDVKRDLTSEKYINNINEQQRRFAEQNSKYLPSYINEANFDQLYNYYSNSPKSNRVSGSSINLGQYSVSPGEDERGRYLSIYDKYDWNLLEGLGFKGRSWETYDRIYEDEWDKINAEKNITMKNGGLSRKEDYGSKKKPYPSVSKGDFAGGDRSYPIPTKADAIDALRLAGLHGRSDVKAKVYKKYPSLKKEFGGQIWDFEKDKMPNIWGLIPAELGMEVPEGYHLMPDGTIMANSQMGGEDYEYAKKGIYIKPENRGKFTATKKRTGKTTEELTHSKNPLTRKRAIFAQNAKKWKKGEYGLEIMQEGGLSSIDPTDPLFAQKIQELIRNNPELAQDIFAPATETTPPGAGQEITTLQPNQTQQMAWEGPEQLNNNINAQNKNIQNNNSNNNSGNRVGFRLPSINFGTALSGLVQGANYLATEYIDNPRRRENEMRLFRRQLAPVTSRPSMGGYDMPILAKSGIQITSAYTNPVGLPSPTKPKRPFGNVANNFKVDDPEFANVLAEGGEFLELPDGQTSTITGDSHSDYSGGEFMNLPEGSKIYSDSIKVDKTFAKDLTGSSSKKKKTVAQLAKKFNTDHEEDILKDPTADPISKRSANIMKTFKQSQLQQLFDYQESVKDPLYMLEKDPTPEDYLGSQDTVVAKKGVKVLQDGGEPPRRGVFGQGVFPYSNTSTYTIVNGQPVLTTGRIADTPVQQLDIDQSLVNEQPWWQNLSSGKNTLLPMGIGLPGNPKYTTPIPEVTIPISTPTSTPGITTPDSTPTPIGELPPELSVPLDPVRGVRAPDLQVAVPPVTIPIGEPIDPNKLRKPIPDNNKVNPPRPMPKVPWGNTLNSLGEIVPEIAAFVQNESDFPIFTSRYQPRYLNPVEMNIQASLNRNYAQTQPLLEGSSGNPSIDNARAAQAIANLYDANNEMFQQKFNFDTQNRYQTDATNLQIENQANLLNLQRADQFWDKVTARQAVKEATRNNIFNSAYAKFKRKQLENRSLQLTNQMFNNFKYDPQKGVYFSPNGEEYIFHEPSGNFINIGTSPGDGVETTRTIKTSPRGTTQTIRQKERRGS